MSTTAVVYLRVSSVGQVNKGTDPEGYSIPSQREVCQKYAEQLGASIVKEYVEPGKSGTNIERPALKKLLADLAELKPDYAIFYDLSRVCRNDFDAQWLWREITEKHGCLIQSTREKVDSSPSGRFMYSILAAVNAMRSRDDAEKVKLNMKRKAALGGTNGKAPIGYLNVRERIDGREVRTVAVDEERADLVRLAFRTYATGDYTISAIAEVLDAAGLRTPMTQKRRPAALARSAVHRMLRDDYYIGLVTYDGVKSEGQHTPLIDVETFERVQEVLKAHTLSGDRSRKHDHYLKGSIYCGQCGGRLLYTQVRGHGGRYEYFRCFGRHNLRNDCVAPHVRVEKVEQEVVRHYFQRPWLTAEEQARARAAVEDYGRVQLRTAKGEADRATRRLAALKAEQQRLLQLAYRDLVDDEVLAAEQERIRQERALVTKWVATADRTMEDLQQALEEALTLVSLPGEAYTKATPAVRRMFNQAVFEQLYVIDAGAVSSVPSPWVIALERLAGRQEPQTAEVPADVPADSPLKIALDRHEVQEHLSRRVGGGLGLHKNQMVRLRGLEPPRPNDHRHLKPARLPIPPQPREQ
jgi:site-specific DNA recombinase